MNHFNSKTLLNKGITFVSLGINFLSSAQEGNTGPMYNVRYCEVLLANFQDGKVRAEVHNTAELSSCPQDQWDTLDAGVIAQERGFMRAIKNGPRFWVLDEIIANNPDSMMNKPVSKFGDIPMRLVATVELAAPVLGGQSGYSPNRVARDTVFQFFVGRRVYQLQSPEGKRYIMQSFTRAIDSDQQLDDLISLGDHLQLPPRWEFTTKVLETSLDVYSAKGIAEVVTDDFGNTYQLIAE